jgi:hypothetical protein
MRSRRSLLLLAVVLGLLSSATATLLIDLLDPHHLQGRISASPWMTPGGGISVAADTTSSLGQYAPLIPGDDPDTLFINAALAGGVVQFQASPPYDQLALQTAPWHGWR